MSDKNFSFAVEMRIFFKDGTDNKDFFWCGELEKLEKREEFPRNSQKHRNDKLSKTKIIRYHHFRHGEIYKE